MSPARSWARGLVLPGSNLARCAALLRRGRWWSRRPDDRRGELADIGDSAGSLRCALAHPRDQDRSMVATRTGEAVAALTRLAPASRPLFLVRSPCSKRAALVVTGRYGKT